MDGWMDGMECDWNPVKFVPSISQSINPLPCTADPADNLTRSDQIQLNSTQIGSDPRAVSSRLVRY